MVGRVAPICFEKTTGSLRLGETLASVLFTRLSYLAISSFVDVRTLDYQLQSEHQSAALSCQGYERSKNAFITGFGIGTQG